MGRPPLDLSLYLVTDTALCGHFGVTATVSAAVGAGVTLVQLRDVDESHRRSSEAKVSWKTAVRMPTAARWFACQRCRRA